MSEDTRENENDPSPALAGGALSDGPAEHAGLELGLPAAEPAASAGGAVVPAEGHAGAQASPVAYRVLARKYRPQNFDDLIGQEAMVRTLSNAFASGRIAQAYILTGVRGVGKTTTARILARALNYEPMDGAAEGASFGPSLDLSVPGKHCRDIIESRHVDVMEMDAASNTSINDIREIIESARYRPVLARYKVYIIDEVHMLSTAAFNGLLKTLEEPPEHVKFIFATTEIRKVPVTVLSRCQRFDLRRVAAGELATHLANICRKEQVEVEDEALSVISRAAEGSVRDSLSLLDQAIAHGSGHVSAEEVRHLLGLADKGRVIDLFEALMKGDMPRALSGLRDQYDAGADPAVILTDLADFTHLVTRLKIVPETANDAALVEAERTRGLQMAEGLSMRVLARAWQMLMKGIGEVQQAPKPVQAAEMVLVRLAYAADLPTPDEALRQLRNNPPEGSQGGPQGGSQGGGAGGAASAGGAPGAVSGGGAGLSLAAGGGMERPARMERADPMARPVAIAAEAGPHLTCLADVVALASAKRDLALKHAVEHNLRPVSFEDGRIEVALLEGASAQVVQDLSRKLLEWTNRRWLVSLSSEKGGATLAEEKATRQAEREEGIKAHPLVAAVLERFPGAQVVDVRTHDDEVAATALAPAEDDTYMDSGTDDEPDF
ncbi:MAG: DNA polymerase III subunit gamma/tau [Xanthobacter sp.]